MTFKPWRMLHLDVRSEFPDLSVDDRTGGVLAVFWCDGRPLGQVEVDATRMPLPGTALREMALSAIAPAVASLLDPVVGDGAETPEHPLSRLREKWAQSNGKGNDGRSVSVVVCTRDRSEALRQCLDSLLTCQPAAAEIVVVDNASRTDDTRRMLEQDYPSVRYVFEPRPGLSIARNRGIAESRGEIVAWTDDDVIVTPEWIGRLLDAFTSPEVMCVTGLVLPAELRTESQWIFERELSGFGRGYKRRVFDSAFLRERTDGAPVWNIGAGANMAVHRRAFEQLGGYDERLGAGAAGCSEDTEFWYRVIAAGWHCHYDPHAVVYHRHREDLAGLHSQMRAYMSGHVAALLVQWARHGHWRNLRRVFMTLPGHYLKHSMYRILPGYPAHRTLRAELAGCAAGVRYYVRTRSAANTACSIPPEEG